MGLNILNKLLSSFSGNSSNDDQASTIRQMSADFTNIKSILQAIEAKSIKIGAETLTAEKSDPTSAQLWMTFYICISVVALFAIVFGCLFIEDEMYWARIGRKAEAERRKEVEAKKQVEERAGKVEGKVDVAERPQKSEVEENVVEGPKMKETNMVYSNFGKILGEEPWELVEEKKSCHSSM